MAIQVGYARVSTLDQNLDGQTEELRLAGAERIYSEYASGSYDERPELAACLKRLEAGDTLIVVGIDRLGRSVSHLVQTVNDLKCRGIHLRSLREQFDTHTAAGELVFTVLGAMAQFERRLISERTHAGLARARAAGRTGGRPSVMTPDRLQLVHQLHDQGLSTARIAQVIGVSKATVARHLTRAGTAT